MAQCRMCNDLAAPAPARGQTQNKQVCWSSVADAQHLLALVLKLVGGSRQNLKTRKTYKNFILKTHVFMILRILRFCLHPSTSFRTSASKCCTFAIEDQQTGWLG